MLLRLLPSLAACALAGLLAAADDRPQVEIRDKDTVVIYGDSITEQNLYAAFIETWLRTRFPGKELSVWNFGWGGDTAAGGAARFARDVAPVRPTLVLVNFGMNDGGYRGPDQGIRERYLAAQRGLAQAIAASGARQVLLTTSPIDPGKRQDGDTYNEALAQMADGVIALGRELKIPVIDQFHPMREVQRRVQAERAGFTMIPDSVHPNPTGHLVMAYHILRGFANAGPVGSIAIADGRLASASGAMVSNLATHDGGVEFDLALPCLPMFVPGEARDALALVPFQQELNALTLSIAGATGPSMVMVDGAEVGSATADRLAQGVDLASFDKAPWTQQAEQVWRLSQIRWQRHFDAWRTLQLNAPDLAQNRSVAAFRAVEADFVRALENELRALARPRSSYHVAVMPQNRVALSTVALSPTYPMKRSEFAMRFDPETGGAVEWKPASLDGDGGIDLNAALGSPTECVVYARLRLQAAAACKLRLSLGSDDGLVVLVNGRRCLERDVYRGAAQDQDQTIVDLQPGANEILIRVNNGDGGYALFVKAGVMGGTEVHAIP